MLLQQRGHSASARTLEFSAVAWCLSRRARNRLVHAEHGNGSRRRLDPQTLRELQPAGLLREAGWSLPATVDSQHLVRVLDTRVESKWLLRAAGSLGLGITMEGMFVVGGDFATEPYRDDAEALAEKLTRWGPKRSGPYQVVVPPRRHVSRWLERARLQIPLEEPGAVVTVFGIAKRAGCAATMDVAALRRWIPWAAETLDDPKVQVSVAAYGERPLLLRLPSQSQKVPPDEWEHSRLEADRVLVAFTLSRFSGERPAVKFAWVMGEAPPPMASMELEFLRVDLANLPGARNDTASRAILAGLRRVAQALALWVPAGHLVRQVAVQPGGEVSAVIGVPKADAITWLRGSGCGGLYLRPLWSDSTSKELQRACFKLLWLRGRRGDGPAVWERLRSEAGFVGLLVDGKDAAVRVKADASSQAIEAQLTFLLGKDIVVRQATPGQRWWKLGPLTEAETYRALELIQKMGLEPLRGELRFGRMGYFRSCVYFAAVGTPSRLTLDDGTWAASHASLHPAEPPPRRGPPSARPAPSGGTQSALAPQSNWAGPRRTDTTPSSPPAPSARRPTNNEHPQPRLQTDTPEAQFHPPAVPTQQPSSPARRRPRRSRNLDPPAPPPDVADGTLKEMLVELRAELAELRQVNNAFREDLRELRRENNLLRQRLAEAEGRRSHNPYVAATGPQPPQSVHPPKRLQSEAAEPIPTSPTVQPSTDINGDLDLCPGGSSPDPKRIRAPEDSTSSPHGL